MPEFYADWEQIMRFGGGIKEQTSRLRSLLYRASDVENNLGNIGSHKEYIQQALRRSNVKFESSILKFTKFANTAINAGDAYRTTENDLMGRANALTPGMIDGRILDLFRPLPPYPRRNWIQQWIGNNRDLIRNAVGYVHDIYEGVNGGVSAEGSLYSNSGSFDMVSMGVPLGLSYFGAFLTGKADAGYEASLKNGIGAHFNAEGSIAEAGGSFKIGDYSYDGKIKVGTGSVKGKVGATLFKGGKLSPSIEAELKAKVAAVEGEVNQKLGNDDFNMHAHADGTLLGAEAEASCKVGEIVYKDSHGVEHKEYGASAKVGAEAYVAKGRVSNGFTILGVNFDVGVEGKFMDASAYAGGEVTSSHASGKVGLGLGLGLGLDFSVDWSGFDYKKVLSWLK